MAKNNTEVQEEEINIDTETMNDGQVEITEFPYDNLVMSVSNFMEQLGQMRWINDNEPEQEGEKSKTISVVRILTNGQKQKFAITVELKNELKIK